jgi:tRNA threonylcarbamoyl adenosine modification protein (Sua5/YciO/YrdC/YwlC family)
MKTEIITVHPEFPDRDKIARCARIIRQGGLVIFPTETVYGIAADAGNLKAMGRLRAVKHRSEGKPFSIMLAHKEDLTKFTVYHDPGVFKLVDRYWPGPLTVIVPAIQPGQTVGLRISDHPVALAFVKECQCPIAAPSANIEGKAPPVTCEEALMDLNGLVDAAIDAGPSHVGVPSSIVDFTQSKPMLIREGTITQEAVDKTVMKKTVLIVCTGNSCRSVMAEYLLRDKLKGRADIDVLSAGTSVFVTASASVGAQQVLRQRGIDAGGHRSQPVSGLLLRKSDLILVMTNRHRDAILQLVPGVEKRVYLLKEFLPRGMSRPDDLDISDPMGQMNQAYEECAQTIDMALDQVVKLL